MSDEQWEIVRDGDDAIVSIGPIRVYGPGAYIYGSEVAALEMCAARDMRKALEYIDEGSQGCVCCSLWREHGDEPHEDHCKLGAALAAARGETKRTEQEKHDAS